MKKTLSLITTSLSILFLLSTASAKSYLTVTVDGANVRTQPDLDAPVSMELFQGYPLEVLEKKGEWYKIVDFEKDSGWIHESIVKNNDSAIVNAQQSVNMRSGPSTKDAIIADVERGVVLTKIERKGKWVKVQHSSGTVGWVYDELLWP